MKIIGGGLAGVEAAWQLLSYDIPVKLYEMRPQKMTPAHTSGDLAELVCSNSLRAASVSNAVGLLKEEMKLLNSLVMEAALVTAVPAGAALAVNRKLFSEYIERKLQSNPLFELVREEIITLPGDITVVASGPLTSERLAAEIKKLIGNYLYFHDAIAPIVSAESLDMDKCFWQSRYEKGDGSDYLNCPMNKDQYDAFYHALIHAELASLHDFDGEGMAKEKTFEGCLPVEVLAGRGEHTLRYGPLKPVGLCDHDGKEPYAVVQLRRENKEGTMFNLVGFQTRLKWGEQKRVFALIPGLEQAEFLRYGAMHRNSYINSPMVLNKDLSLKAQKQLFFAGQLTGVEGYVESAACGIAAGINAARTVMGKSTIVFPMETALGGLLNYICTHIGNFQPMNISFGLLPAPAQHFMNKQQKNEFIAQKALKAMQDFIANTEKDF